MRPIIAALILSTACVADDHTTDEIAGGESSGTTDEIETPDAVVADLDPDESQESCRSVCPGSGGQSYCATEGGSCNAPVGGTVTCYAPPGAVCCSSTIGGCFACHNPAGCVCAAEC